jgi:predicted RNA-binding Zn-ribbon protein involved in translation (DUF1610 family)
MGKVCTSCGLTPIKEEKPAEEAEDCPGCGELGGVKEASEEEGKTS